MRSRVLIPGSVCSLRPIRLQGNPKLNEHRAGGGAQRSTGKLRFFGPGWGTPIVVSELLSGKGGIQRPCGVLT
jgi:hypothetical protein